MKVKECQINEGKCFIQISIKVNFNIKIYTHSRVLAAKDRNRVVFHLSTQLTVFRHFSIYAKHNLVPLPPTPLKLGIVGF